MKPASCPPTRRAVVAGLAATALAPLEARSGAYDPKLAVQTSVWLPPSDQPESIFNGCQRAGCRRLWLDPRFSRPAMRAETWRLLRQYKLEAPALMLDPGDGNPLEAARGLREGGVLWVETAAWPAGVDAESRRLNQLGLDLRRLGLGLMLRSGPAEMQGGGGRWRALIRETERGLVGLSLDLDAAVQAGMDPIPLLDEASARLESVVLTSRRNGAPLEEIGEGRPDMPAIAAFLRRMNYDGFLVVNLPALEARTQTVAMALAHSRWYVHQVFGFRPGAPPVDMGPHVRTRRS